MEYHKDLVDIKWRRFKVDAVPLKELVEGTSYLIILPSVLTMDDFIDKVPPGMSCMAKFFNAKEVHYGGIDPYGHTYRFTESPMLGRGGSYSLHNYGASDYLVNWIVLPLENKEGRKLLDPYNIPDIGFTGDKLGDNPFDLWQRELKKPLGPLINPGKTLVGSPPPYMPTITTDNTGPYLADIERMQRQRDADFQELLEQLSKEKK